MANATSVGVIGLKPEDRLKFPNHKFGASIHFFDEPLSQVSSLISFCNSVDQIFAFTIGIPSKAMLSIPKNKLFVLGGNSSASTLAERLEKKFGIIERDDGNSVPETIRPLVVNKIAVEAPKSTAADPYLIPLDWRRSIIVGRTSQMRYPVQSERLKTIEFIQGNKSDYSFLKAANPGDVVRYMNRPGEPKADVEHRAIYVMSNWPDRVGFDLEAHIHNDSIYYLITTVRRSAGQPAKPTRVLGSLREFREAMIAWDDLKGHHKPSLEVVEETAKGTVEATVVAVDESIEVPDSPVVEETSHGAQWPANWVVGGTVDGVVRFRPGSVEPTPLVRRGGRYDYGPLKVAVPGSCYSYDYVGSEVNITTLAVAIRYPVMTYSSRCGYLIEAHAFGSQIVLFVTDVPYLASHHKNFTTLKNKTDFIKGVSSDNPEETTTTPAERAAVLTSPIRAGATDVVFWKEIYRTAISRGDDNQKAKMVANQALADLASVE